MNNEELVKALRCLSQAMNKDCSLSKCDVRFCEYWSTKYDPVADNFATIVKEAADCIDSLQSEIEYLKRVLENTRNES